MEPSNSFSLDLSPTPEIPSQFLLQARTASDTAPIKRLQAPLTHSGTYPPTGMRQGLTHTHSASVILQKTKSEAELKMIKDPMHTVTAIPIPPDENALAAKFKSFKWAKGKVDPNGQLQYLRIKDLTIYLNLDEKTIREREKKEGSVTALLSERTKQIQAALTSLQQVRELDPLQEKRLKTVCYCAQGIWCELFSKDFLLIDGMFLGKQNDHLAVARNTGGYIFDFANRRKVAQSERSEVFVVENLLVHGKGYLLTLSTSALHNHLIIRELFNLYQLHRLGLQNFQAPPLVSKEGTVGELAQRQFIIGPCFQEEVFNDKSILTLNGWLKTEPSKEDRIEVCMQMWDQLQQLIKNGFYHGNISSDRFMVAKDQNTRKMRVVLTDWSQAHLDMKKFKGNRAGTIVWYPEFLFDTINNSSNPESRVLAAYAHDFFAVVCCMHVVLTGEIPYEVLNEYVSMTGKLKETSDKVFIPEVLRFFKACLPETINSNAVRYLPCKKEDWEGMLKHRNEAWATLTTKPQWFLEERNQAS